jgi:saccharopine dehydrogenase-like NADP-dependent oxidoreductase
MKSVIVLGGGMVGSAMALDLAPHFQVTVVDVNQAALDRLKRLNPQLTTLNEDLRSRATVERLIGPFDYVLSAVPGAMGFATLQTILEAGKNVVDISFFPENSLDLQALAKQKGVTAIVDCGVAPGMDNIILGYYDTQMKLTDFECLVGGLPKVRTWPWVYKAPFSPADVIEEYVRPARYVENGVIVTRTALSDPELLQFEGVGTLESFNTDGLRSIMFTMSHIPNMKEKTLRYPGHIEYVRVLRESGFFDTTPISVAGQMVKPLDFTSKLLFKEWKLGETEPEFTVMRVSVTGEANGQRRKVTYDLYDEYDPKTQTSSMARTTGYTATAAIHLLDKGVFSEKGLFPPELIGRHKVCFDFFLGYLEERGIRYRKSEEVL